MTRQLITELRRLRKKLEESDEPSNDGSVTLRSKFAGPKKRFFFCERNFPQNPPKNVNIPVKAVYHDIDPNILAPKKVQEIKRVPVYNLPKMHRKKSVRRVKKRFNVKGPRNPLLRNRFLDRNLLFSSSYSDSDSGSDSSDDRLGYFEEPISGFPERRMNELDDKILNDTDSSDDRKHKKRMGSIFLNIVASSYSSSSDDIDSSDIIEMTKKRIVLPLKGRSHKRKRYNGNKFKMLDLSSSTCSADSTDNTDIKCKSTRRKKSYKIIDYGKMLFSGAFNALSSSTSSSSSDEMVPNFRNEFVFKKFNRSIVKNKIEKKSDKNASKLNFPSKNKQGVDFSSDQMVKQILHRNMPPYADSDDSTTSNEEVNEIIKKYGFDPNKNMFQNEQKLHRDKGKMKYNKDCYSSSSTSSSNKCLRKEEKNSAETKENAELFSGKHNKNMHMLLDKSFSSTDSETTQTYSDLGYRIPDNNKQKESRKNKKEPTVGNQTDIPQKISNMRLYDQSSSYLSKISNTSSSEPSRKGQKDEKIPILGSSNEELGNLEWTNSENNYVKSGESHGDENKSQKEDLSYTDSSNSQITPHKKKLESTEFGILNQNESEDQQEEESGNLNEKFTLYDKNILGNNVDVEENNVSEDSGSFLEILNKYAEIQNKSPSHPDDSKYSYHPSTSDGERISNGQMSSMAHSEEEKFIYDNPQNGIKKKNDSDFEQKQNNQSPNILNRDNTNQYYGINDEKNNIHIETSLSYEEESMSIDGYNGILDEIREEGSDIVKVIESKETENSHNNIEKQYSSQDNGETPPIKSNQIIFDIPKEEIEFSEGKLINSSNMSESGEVDSESDIYSDDKLDSSSGSEI